MHIVTAKYGLIKPLIISLGILFITACSGGNGVDSNNTTTPTTSVPADVSATANDGYNSVNWTAVSGASLYNIYWSTNSSITKTNSSVFEKISAPFNHTALTNGTQIFYRIAAITGTTTGNLSSEVNATPVNGAGTADEFYSIQWHLNNTVNANEDVNTTTAWSCGSGATCRGEGVKIAVVDDGLELKHEDLFANIVVNKSYNYSNATLDPSPSSSSTTDGHGTAVAGLIAARDLNTTGVRGVAPRGQLVGFNVLSNPTTANIANALTRDFDTVAIYNNSWGFLGGTGELNDSDSTWKSAIDFGIQRGRKRLGSIYVYSAGNGGNRTLVDDIANNPYGIDNANYNGYAIHRGVIAVAAVDIAGKKSSYSELGANLLVSAPGGEQCDSASSDITITTTDLSDDGGYNTSSTPFGENLSNTSYSKCFNGTSSAAPIVSGVIALMLQKNPNLSWRDVQIILARSARKNDTGDTAGWKTGFNYGSGTYNFNHKYGFGVVDAGAAVALATGWTNVGTELFFETPASPATATDIPDNGSLTDTVTVAASGITTIERIEVVFAATTPFPGDLEVTLTNATTGAVSILSNNHTCSGTCSDYSGWVFSTHAHKGEAADVNWTLTVYDRRSDVEQPTQTLDSWFMRIYGR